MKTFFSILFLSIAMVALPVEAKEPLEATEKIAPSTVIAKVLGKDVTRADIEPTAEWLEQREKHLREKGKTLGLVSLEEYRRGKLSELLWRPLEQKFREEQNLEVTEEAIAKFIEVFREAGLNRLRESEIRLQQLAEETASLKQKLEDDSLPEPERKRLEERLKSRRHLIEIHQKSIARRQASRDTPDERMERFTAQWQIKHWLLQQALYKKYGGRVIAQQAGAEAIDAMRDFLREHESKGDLGIYDKGLADIFWEPFTRDNPGVVLKKEIADRLFTHPWSMYEEMEE